MDMSSNDNQIETNGPPTAGDREMAFHALRSKMGHLEEVIEDIGQFVCENQLEDHFINFVFRLSSVSKELNTEISTVESYLDFIKRHNVTCSRNTGYFSVVPDEVTIHVFSYLNESELSNAASVCREWHSLTADNTLWKSLYARYWGADAAARVSSNHLYRPKPLPLDTIESAKTPLLKKPTVSTVRRFSLWPSSSFSSSPSPLSPSPSSPSPSSGHGTLPPAASAAPAGGASTAMTFGGGRMHSKIGKSRIMYKAHEEDDDVLEETERRDQGKWKSLFMKYHRTKRNWDTGKYSLVTLTHHKNTVRCVQFDENYNMITASDDKTVQRLDWDADKGAYVPKMKLTGHEGGIICMQFDGNQMITGSRDKTLRLWDLEKGKTISTFKNHTGQVWCLQFDKHKIVSGSDDKRLNVWDINSGKLITDLQGHSWGIGCLQFDSTKVISGAADKTIKVWDLAMMRCIQTLKGHKSSVRCVQFDDTKIVSGSWDNTIKIWDANTYRTVDTLQGHSNKLMCLQFDESKIISGAQDKTIMVWDLNTGKHITTLQSHTDSLCDLHFDDCKLVTGSRDKTVKVWDFS